MIYVEKDTTRTEREQRVLFIVIFREFGRKKMESVVSAAWVLIRLKVSWHQRQPL